MQQISPSISIIIPVLNEAEYIGSLLDHLNKICTAGHVGEILVVDGGSRDGTAALAQSHGAKVIPSGTGRAVQLNNGAKNASGDIFYFLHADTFPPRGFDEAVVDAVRKGNEAGCFRMQFDYNSRFLSFFAWCSCINHNLCRGGDQSLFITKRLFWETGGYNESFRIYEDNEFTSRLYKCSAFVVLPQKVTTSARKYRQMNMLKLQLHFGVIHLKKFCGAGPDSLYRYYRKNIAV
jgi:rSAM/selenodomain-associated transferase 2